MKPLRFCMVTTFYPPYGFGGDAIAVQNLARALVRGGHSVTVVHDVDAFSMLGGKAVCFHPEEGLQPDGVHVVPLRTATPTLSALATHQTGGPALKRAVLRRVLARGFDVIHFHNVSLIGGPGVLQYGSGVKLYSAHEHWLVCPTHVLWKNGREPCSRPACLQCVLRARRPLQLWRYTGHLRRQGAHIDAFLAMSEFSRAKHRELGLAYDMTVLSPLVPDVERDAGPRPHAGPYFLFSGRLEPMKGLADVVPLFAEPETGSGADLVVAGAGSQRDALERLAGGNPRVRFLGQVDASDLAKLYQHAVATVSPSIGFETFGLSIVESFRAGTPVIARRIGPFPELVEGAAGGVLFSTQAELRAALTEMAQDSSLRAHLGMSARAAFLDSWVDTVSLPHYLSLVEQLIAAKAKVASFDGRRPGPASAFSGIAG